MAMALILLAGLSGIDAKKLRRWSALLGAWISRNLFLLRSDILGLAMADVNVVVILVLIVPFLVLSIEVFIRVASVVL